jgi:hypothetical protein
LTKERLGNFETSTKNIDEILNSQRSPNNKIGPRYNDNLKTIKQEKKYEKDGTNTLEEVEEQ